MEKSYEMAAEADGMTIEALRIRLMELQALPPTKQVLRQMELIRKALK